MKSVIEMNTMIKGQVMSLPEFSVQMVQSHCIDDSVSRQLDKLEITEETEFVFLGCGDSAAAGEVSASIAKQLIKVSARAENITQFQYFDTSENFSCPTVLVLTSVSGASPIMLEAVGKAKGLGIKTLKIGRAHV